LYQVYNISILTKEKLKKQTNKYFKLQIQNK